VEINEWGSQPEFFGPRHYYRESILIKNIKKFFKKGKVLDAGFGNGSLSLRVAKNNYEITGIDLSEKFVEHVSEKIKNFKNIKIEQGDITNLKFNNETFDAIFCGEILEHIENDDTAIKELFRVLTPGGLVFISVPANPKLWDKSDTWASHHRRYTKKSLNSLLTNNKFKVKKMHYWGFPVTRIYHKKLYLKSLNNQKLKNSKIKKYSKPLSLIFKIDNLFNWTNKGIGLIAVAEKPKENNNRKELLQN